MKQPPHIPGSTVRLGVSSTAGTVLAVTTGGGSGGTTAAWTHSTGISQNLFQNHSNLDSVVKSFSCSVLIA